MASVELEKRWRVVTVLLRRAQRALPRRDDPEYLTKASEFEEYIEHNELGLALNTLEEIAELVLCHGGFWRDLERAATVMGLSENAGRFRTHFLKSKPNSN